MKIIRKYLLVTIILVTPFTIFSQEDKLSEKLESLANQISNYNFGDERVALMEFNDLLIESLNSQKNLEVFADQMIKILESDATLDGKDFICRRLAELKSEKTIDVLISMIQNPKTINMARYALDKMPFDSINDKLINELSNSTPPAQVAIINSLGDRKSKSALNILEEFVYLKDESIALAAAKSLGKIRGTESAKIIQSSFSKELSEDIRLELIESYLLCAREFLSEGEFQSANDIYEEVYNNFPYKSKKQAALVGMIATAETGRDSILLNIFTNNDVSLLQGVFTKFEDLIFLADLKMLADNFDLFESGVQEKLLLKAAEIELIELQSLVRRICKTKEGTVREASIKTIGAIGSEQDIELLIEIAGNGDFSLKSACQDAINNLKGEKVDKELIRLLPDAGVESSIMLIRAIDTRRIKSGFEALTGIASGENQKLRIETYSALATIAEPSNLGVLTKIFLQIDDPRELKRFESTLARISLKNPEKNNRAKDFLAAIDETNNFETEMSLLRILGATGDQNAFSKIEEYLSDENDDVKKTAILSLYNWPNLDPLDRLIEIVADSENDVLKILALRGYINLLKTHGLNLPDDIVDYYKTASNYAENKSEKTMILSGLAEINNLESAEFVSTFLNDPELKPEAQISLLAILSDMKWWNPNKALEYMEMIDADPASEDISLRVKRLIKSTVTN